MQQQCRAIEQKFRAKFGVLPHVTFELLSGYGNNFCIWKSNNLCLEETNSFYKMGSTLSQAIEYIERLIEIPSAIITFTKNDEKVVYMLQLEMNNLYLKEKQK